MKASVALTSSGYSDRSLEINGVHLPGVRGATITANVGEIDTCTVDLILLEGLNYEGVAEVLIPEKTREALEILGWTPPA